MHVHACKYTCNVSIAVISIESLIVHQLFLRMSFLAMYVWNIAYKVILRDYHLCPVCFACHVLFL